MSERVAVHWFPHGSMRRIQVDKSVFVGGEQRPFENLETAIQFVMEDLPHQERIGALIQTPQAVMYYTDILRWLDDCNYAM